MSTHPLNLSYWGLIKEEEVAPVLVEAIKGGKKEDKEKRYGHTFSPLLLDCKVEMTTPCCLCWLKGF